MDWRQALETVIERTGHARYLELCADDHPDHLIWRARVVSKATGEAPAAYPSVATMAGNLAGAIGRAVGAAVTGKAVMVPDEEYRRRLAICEACDKFDASQSRCRLCGCVTQWKAKLKTEECPAGKW